MTSACAERLDNVIGGDEADWLGYSLEALQPKVIFDAGALRRTNVRPTFERCGQAPQGGRLVEAWIAGRRA